MYFVFVRTSDSKGERTMTLEETIEYYTNKENKTEEEKQILDWLVELHISRSLIKLANKQNAMVSKAIKTL